MSFDLRQVRRSERLISHSSSSSQFMFLEDHEDLVDWKKYLKKELRDIDDDDFVELFHYEHQSTLTTTRRDRSSNHITHVDVKLFNYQHQSISITTRRDRSSNHITHVENNDFVPLSQLKHQRSLSRSSIFSLSTSREASQRNSRRVDKKLDNK